VRDSWAALPDWTHHTKEQVLKLLEGFEIEDERRRKG
jgi:hypothetical protein